MGMDAVGELYYGIYIGEVEWTDDFDEKIGKLNEAVEGVSWVSIGYESEIIGLSAYKKNTVARWDVPLGDSLPAVDPEWDAKLKKACEFLGLEYKQPEWHLSSRLS